MAIALQPEQTRQFGDIANEGLTEWVQVQRDEKALKRRATMQTWKKRIIRIALGIFAMSTFTFCLIPTGPASAGTCGQIFNDIEVDGGEAAWSLSCSGRNITIDGWVKDTDADGMCAYVKATGNGRWMPQAKACPKNTKTPFRWTVPGGEINAHLYVS